MQVHPFPPPPPLTLLLPPVCPASSFAVQFVWQSPEGEPSGGGGPQAQAPGVQLSDSLLGDDKLLAAFLNQSLDSLRESVSAYVGVRV